MLFKRSVPVGEYATVLYQALAAERALVPVTGLVQSRIDREMDDESKHRILDECWDEELQLMHVARTALHRLEESRPGDRYLLGLHNHAKALLMASISAAAAKNNAFKCAQSGDSRGAHEYDRQFQTWFKRRDTSGASVLHDLLWLRHKRSQVFELLRLPDDYHRTMQTLQ